MGSAFSSSLPSEAIQELSHSTFCKITVALHNLFYLIVSAHEIEKLYARFVRLDRDRSGTLSMEELLTIPEFAMNPLAERMLSIFQENQRIARSASHDSVHRHQGHRTPTQVDDDIDFKTFLHTLSPFSVNAPIIEKLKCTFLFF
jgi:serine/threonine-protein phosphatase 2B regulatory subunit